MHYESTNETQLRAEFEDMLQRVQERIAGHKSGDTYTIAYFVELLDTTTVRTRHVLAIAVARGWLGRNTRGVYHKE